MSGQAGIALGLTVGIVIGLFLVALLFKLKVVDMTFDERQERARGQAYRWGFWTLVLCLFLYGLSDMVLGRWCEVSAGVILCIFAALGVFASVCIVKGAYLGLQEKPRTVKVSFAVIGTVNLAIGAMHLAGGSLVEDGVLTSRVVNLAGGVMILVILAVYIAHDTLGKREDEE